MPATQLEVVDARRHRLRHIKPYVAGQGTVQSAQTVLGRTYAFEELPISSIPTARDFSEGSWTGRLGDAGQAEVKFPNKEASDGQPWRSRFNTFGHLEFIEIYRDDVLEHVDVILTCKPDQQAVVLTGQDGWFLLREAYERNWVCVQAPRDVIERASYVWLPTFASVFQGEHFEKWEWRSIKTEEGAKTLVTLEAGPHGEEVEVETEESALGNHGTGGFTTNIVGKASPITIPANGRWRAILNFTLTKAEGGLNWTLTIAGVAAGAPSYVLRVSEYLEPSVNPASALMYLAEGAGAKFEKQTTLPISLTGGQHTFEMESDGRFVRGYVDGYFVGELPAAVLGEAEIEFVAGTESTLFPRNRNRITINQCLFRQAVPFLMRGTEKGDYVLPGGVQTYPYGGLTGRYYNDLDLQETPEYWRLCFAQERSLNKQIQYQDRTDAQINNPVPPFPGASETYWSVRWFGAIYLKLSAGNYPIECKEMNDGVRIWVGKTQFGDQVLDSWIGTAYRNVGATINAAALGGKDGWYPIIIEHFVGGGAPKGGVYFTPPASYTDPGGTAITAAQQLIPSTSLTPLGCVDQHYQGQSHFNISKETAEAFGYQMYCEPRQLESGEFPGQLVPKARIGRDTDEILESDSITSRSPIVNYSNLVDATDQATSLLGTGSGLPNGQNGQISAEEFDIPTMIETLFDLQGWVDAADINSPSLLAARVAAQLSLQLEPWQNVEGEPLARDRLADTFPLTGVLSAMRWRPGDGIRIFLPDINIQDTTPRQILQVTRQFGPIGRHGTQMGFRQRPLDRLSQVNHQLRRALQPQRNYQRTILGLPCTQLREEIAAGAEGAVWSLIPILVSDVVIDAQLLILNNTTGQPLHVIMNGIDVTTEWGGPWTHQPTAIRIRNLRPESSGVGGRQAAYVRIKNAGNAATFVEAIPLIRVLR